MKRPLSILLCSFLMPAVWHLGIKPAFTSEIKKSVEPGNADAQNTLGGRYYYGRNVNVNYIEAVKWYRKAAKQADAEGQYNLGTMYENGHGVEKKRNEAIRWYGLAARQGDEFAQKNLSYLGETW
ncbi:tetratricopeptide repeat protein [Runella sp.]|uniref:tetratricopeptide repeat protein n=1 Tax=Runella sp. TaxID=1960881 RepID=UPI003015AF3F